MAHITIDSMLNSYLEFPYHESGQANQNLFPSFTPLNIDSGAYPACNSVGGNYTINEFENSRHESREDDFKQRKISNVMPAFANETSKNNQCCCSSSLLGCDISARMHKEQEELDILILMQMENIRTELEQKRRNHIGNLVRAIEVEMQKVLMYKEQEIGKMCERNKALEETVRSLSMESQTWKKLAQRNEAMVMSLQRDIELAQAREEGEGDSGQLDSSMSCCDAGRPNVLNNNSINGSCCSCKINKINILSLPCRHLCLCSECDRRYGICPICMSAKTASIQVQMP